MTAQPPNGGKVVALGTVHWMQPFSCKEYPLYTITATANAACATESYPTCRYVVDNVANNDTVAVAIAADSSSAKLGFTGKVVCDSVDGKMQATVISNGGRRNLRGDSTVAANPNAVWSYVDNALEPAASHFVAGV